MADATTVGASTAASAVSAAIAATLGLDSQVLLWSFLGTGAGASWAVEIRRVSAVLTITSTMLIAALLATWLASQAGAGDGGRNVLATLIGAGGQKLLANIAQALEPVVIEWINKFRPQKPL